MLFHWRIARRLRQLGLAVAASTALIPSIASAQVPLQTPIATNQSNFQTSANVGLGFEIVNGAVVDNATVPSAPAFLVDDPLLLGVTVSNGAIDADTENDVASALVIDDDIGSILLPFVGGIENNDLISATSTATGDTPGDATAYAVRFLAGDITFSGELQNTANGRIEALAETTYTDAAAYGILVEPITAFAGGIDLQGEMDVRATVALAVTVDNGNFPLSVGLDSDSLAEAYGLEVVDTSIVGNILTRGDLEVVAENTIDFTGTSATNIAVSEGALAQGAVAEGVHLTGDLLVGSLRLQDTLSVAATAGYEVAVTSTGGDPMGLIRLDVDGLAEHAGLDSFALGYGAEFGTMGAPLGADAFNNAGIIGATATSRLSGTATADATGNAQARITDDGGTDAAEVRAVSEAVGVRIGGSDEALVFGDIVNEAGSSIAASATSSVELTGSATSSDGTATATIGVDASRVFAEATGLDVDVQTLAGNALLSLTGDVTNAGDIAAQSLAQLVTSITGNATESVSAATQHSATTQSIARGGSIQANLLLGDVVVEPTGLYSGAATSINSATASATSSNTDGTLSFSAEAGAIATRAEADGIGLGIFAETLTGDVQIDGAVMGTAAASSIGTATATLPSVAGNTNANATSYWSFAEAKGLQLAVGTMTGDIVNSGADTLSATATTTSSSTATATGGRGAAAAANVQSETLEEPRGAQATALEIVAGDDLSVFVGSIRNAGKIAAEATATSTTSATSSGDDDATSIARDFGTDARAFGVVVGIDAVAGIAGFGGEIANAAGATITAKATGNAAATASATATQDDGQLASRALAGSTAAVAAGVLVGKDGFLGEEVAVLTGFDNAGTIQVEAKGSVSQSATSTGGAAAGLATVFNGRATANAWGANLNAAGILSRIDNSGTIAVSATAAQTSSAIVTVAGAGRAAVLQDEMFGIDDANADADGIRIATELPFLVGFINSGTLAAQATATQTATATLNGGMLVDEEPEPTAPPDGASVLLFDTVANVDGLEVEVEDGLVAGGIENVTPGIIQAAATATRTVTATQIATAEGSVAAATVIATDIGAFGDGIDLEGPIEDSAGVATLLGGIDNAGLIQSQATVNSTLDASASADARAAAHVRATGAESSLSPVAEADGIDIAFTQLISGGIDNSGRIAATATASFASTVGATVAAGGEDGEIANADARVDYDFWQRAEATGIEVTLVGEDAAFAGISGDIVNSGRIDAVASAATTIAVTASSGEGDSAARSDTFLSVLAYAVGIDIDLQEDFFSSPPGGSINDAVINTTSGIIVATATATTIQTTNATGALGAEAVTGSTSGAVRPYSFAIGVNADGATVQRLENAGQIQATAESTHTAGATANSSDGDAVARLEFAHAVSNAFGMQLLADTVVDGVENSGTILARAESTATGTGTATGDGAAIVSVYGSNTSAIANAIRVDLNQYGFEPATVFNGGFDNRGTLAAEAVSASTHSATGTGANDDPIGLRDGVVTDGGTNAKADGAYISVNGVLNGGALNSAEGVISAVSSATSTRSATQTLPAGAEGGTATVLARLVSADSDGIDLEGLQDPIAQPMVMTVLSGGVSNLGSITAAATATATSLATTTGSGGTSQVEVLPSFRDPFSMLATSAAIDVAVSQALHGGLTNAGLLKSTSAATQSVTATTTVDAAATAIASSGPVGSFSRGIEFDANTVDGALLDGGASNGRMIDVSATATVTTVATATGSEASGQVYTDLVTTSAQGIDLDLTGTEAVFDEDIQQDVTVPIGGTILGSVVNQSGGQIQVQAKSTVTSAITATGYAQLLQDGAVTEATGISVDTLAMTGNVLNQGSIVATANGPHSTTATATEHDAFIVLNPSGRPRFLSLAQGLFLVADGVDGDFGNSGSILATAREDGAQTATVSGENAAGVDMSDGSEAVARGMELSSPDVDGSFANEAGGAIGAQATATLSSTVSRSAATEGVTAFYASLASAAGLDLQPNTASARALSGEGPEIVTLAAYDLYADPATPGLLTGRFDNLGTIQAAATATTTFVLTGELDGPLNRGLASSAVAQGMGSSTRAIDGGVGNWGDIRASASATLSAATPGGSLEVSAIAYGILLVAPQRSDTFQDFPVLAIPEPVGVVGDSDGNGVAIENHGLASASSTVTETGQDSADLAYAAGLQVGRGGEIIGTLRAFATPPQPPTSANPAGMTVEGDILNTGTLAAAATASGATQVEEPGTARAFGLALYDSIVEGNVDNSGPNAVIAATTAGFDGWSVGILVERSIIEGAINTSGLITATTVARIVKQADAINTVAAGAATTINVLDGIGANDQLSPEDNPLWTGDNPVGIIGDIRLAKGFGDTVNWSGGDIQGDIIGDALCDQLCLGFGLLDDVVNVIAGAADAFDYDGLMINLLALNINTAANAGAPVELTMRGTVVTTVALNVNDNGTLVIGKEYDGFFDAGFIDVETYNHADGGTVLFEIDGGSTPGEAGFIIAHGTSTLNIEGGIIGIRPTGAFYADEAFYEVIYADSRNGVFDGTFSPTPLLQVAVEYGDYDGAPGTSTDATPGDVHFAPDFFDDSDSDVRLHVTRVPFDEVEGLTPNQKAVAGAIEDVFGPDLEGTEFGDGIAFLFLTDDYQEALSELHGAEHAQTANLVGQLSGLFNQWLADRRTDANGGQSASTQSYAWSPDLEQIAAAKALDGDADAEQVAEFARGGARTAGSFSVWFGGGGLWGSADADGAQDVQGFDQRTWGGMVGIDYQIDSQFLVGLAGLYQTTNAEFDDDSTSDVDSFQAGLYGTWDSGTLYVDALASVGWSSIDNARRIVIPSVFEGTAKSDTDAFLLTLGAEVGYAFRFDGGFSVTPLAGLDYRHASIDGYEEHGASPYNLAVGDTDVDSLTSTLGFALGGDFDLGGMRLSPELRAAWQHEFLDSEQDITAAFVAEPGASFTAVGSDFGADAGLVGAGVTLEISSGVEAFVDYNGRFSGGYAANAVSGGLRLSW